MSSLSTFSSTALIINANSEVGVRLVKDITKKGYHVVALAINTAELLDALYYTNPEIRGSFTVRTIKDPSDSVVNDDFLAGLKLDDYKPLDVVISLNPTIDDCVQWDLQTILGLSENKGLAKDALVMVGRARVDPNNSLNAQLESLTSKLQKNLTSKNITFLDLISLSALPGDEEYLSSVYLNEIVRKEYKVETFDSIPSFLDYLIYFYIPGFLLIPFIYLRNLLLSILTVKEKTS